MLGFFAHNCHLSSFNVRKRLRHRDQTRPLRELHLSTFQRWSHSASTQSCLPQGLCGAANRSRCQLALRPCLSRRDRGPAGAPPATLSGSRLRSCPPRSRVNEWPMYVWPLDVQPAHGQRPPAQQFQPVLRELVPLLRDPVSAGSSAEARRTNRKLKRIRRSCRQN